MTASKLEAIPRTVVAIIAVATLGACTDDPAAPTPSTAARLDGASASTGAAKNGGKIAFINTIGTDQWLYIMNADGSDVTRVSTTNYAYEADPTWSPDYRSVVYIDYWAVNALKRYMVANGRVETIYSAPGSIANPQFSPDGSKIAFDLELGGSRDVYFMNADGSNLTKLTIQGTNRHPTWSPDGQRIAYETTAGDGMPKLYVKNIDGTNGHVVTACKFSGLPSGYCLSPRWSPVPGDERIAYGAVESGYTSLRIINVDGTGDTPVIMDATVNDKEPAWSRDGTKLAFRSKLTGTSYPDIYSINTDGTGLRQLTARADALSPAWAR